MRIGLSVKHYLKRLTLLGGVLAFVCGSATFVDRVLAQGTDEVPAVASDQHVLTIHDRGDEQVLITKASTLGEALKLAGIEISAGHDVVEPSLDSELVASNYSINIYRARPITVVDGVVKRNITTAEQTPERIAKAAGITIYSEDQTDFSAPSDILSNGSSQVMSIDRATVVQFTLYGKHAEVRTRATTVEEFLKEKSIKIGANDYLSVDKGQAISTGMAIELWREGKQTVTVEEEVDFEIEKVQDANREAGYREVKTPGVKGKRNATYEIEMKNGQEASRTEIASVTIEEPKKQVEIIGAKLPTPTNPTEAQAIGKEMMLAAGFGEDQWGCLYNLWMRESGWRTTAGNVSSGAYGIPQSLPASKMAAFGGDYLTNPRTQIAWGLSYIKGRYGTPCGGWSAFQAKGWY
jgi:uncharacterized protein YabE (DUF348 family)